MAATAQLERCSPAAATAAHKSKIVRLQEGVATVNRIISLPAKSEVRNPAKAALVLFLVVSVTLAGCATEPAWTTVSTDYEPVSTRTVRLNDGAERETARVFEISDPYVGRDGIYQIGVTERRTETTFQRYREVERQQLRQDMHQTRTVRVITEAGWWWFGMGGGFGVLGALLAVVSWPDDDNCPYGLADGQECLEYRLESSPSDEILWISLGTLLLSSIIAATNNEPNIESRTVVGEELTPKESVIETSRRKVGDEVTYDGVARNIPVRVRVSASSGGRASLFEPAMPADTTARTDSSGEIRLPAPAYWAPSRRLLGDKLGNSSIAAQIVARYRPEVLREVLAVSEAHDLTFTVATVARDGSAAVTNDSERVAVSGYRITEAAVRDYVGDEIDPIIMNVAFRVQDAVSTQPIRGAEVRIKAAAPTKAQLAGRYLTGRLRDYVAGQIGDYRIGESAVSAPQGRGMARILTGSVLDIEVMHDAYHTVAGEVEIGTATAAPATVQIHMVEKGTRISADDAAAMGRVALE